MHDNIIKQAPVRVIDFSSQYGSETSCSYTIDNLVGCSTIYPKYGDYTTACVFVSEYVYIYTIVSDTDKIGYLKRYLKDVWLCFQFAISVCLLNFYTAVWRLM